MKFDLLLRKLRTGTKYIDLRKRLENNYSEFTYYPPFWRLYYKKLKNINFEWKVIKYDSDTLPDLEPGTPGIYLFVLRPPNLVFESYSYVMYVGMSDEGLKERLNKGYRMPSSVKLRPHIHRLILDYGQYLYWYYLPFPNNTMTEIEDIETTLIGYFCDPPINRDDQPIEIAEANKSKMR